MNTLDTYQSDAMERPLIRRWLFLGLVISLILHAGIIYWFRQTPLPQFNAPTDRLVPRIFNVKNITIDEKLLDGEDQAPAKPKVEKQALKPLDLPDERPVADVKEGKLTPAAPLPDDAVKAIAEKPSAETSFTKTIAQVQSTAAVAMEQDLKTLSDSLIKDQPANVTGPGIVLPNPADETNSDAQAMATASGQLDKLLGHGLRPGTGPVRMPGGAMFEFDKADLRTAAIDQMRKLGMLIEKSPNVIFSIEGYTDSFGDAAYNRQLSQQRADAVRNWLIQNMDVNPDHIKAIGFGATNFIVPPKPVNIHSQESIDQEKLLEQKNRRVEIRFKFESGQ